RTYAYDLNGNRTSQMFDYGDATVGNRLTTVAIWTAQGHPWATHHYDGNGNLVQKCKNQQDPQAVGWVEYGYDHRNQMTSTGGWYGATCPDGVTQPADISGNYWYDVFGRRVAKVAQRTTPTVYTEKIRFAYDGQTLWADLVGDANPPPAPPQ